MTTLCCEYDTIQKIPHVSLPSFITGPVINLSRKVVECVGENIEFFIHPERFCVSLKPDGGYTKRRIRQPDIA